MTIPELQTAILKAFRPFASGFLQESRQSILTVEITARMVAGTLQVTQRDFHDMTDENEVALQDAFHALSRYLDPQRGPAFEVKPK